MENISVGNRASIAERICEFRSLASRADEELLRFDLASTDDLVETAARKNGPVKYPANAPEGLRSVTIRVAAQDFYSMLFKSG
ncbi:hypothetical protein HZH66_009922 [Vespula vulgaris]|uniref:Uncharacterized protein n=1 Tax=Vespula vulgaris TaxID=7454 RepID=A0A834MXE1_VESVU|nr:hypothetical protein HZH66_009922 [Vespula vulgaris]